MSKMHKLPMNAEKTVELLNRRYDALYDLMLRRFCRGFSVIVTDMVPLLVAVRRTIESTVDDAKPRDVPPEALSSLPRLLLLCDEVERLCSVYRRLLGDYETRLP